MIDQQAAKRLQIVYESFEGGQVDFAKFCDVSQPSISRMLAGTQPIPLEVIKVICLKLGYDPMWMITGIGPAKVKEQKSTLVTDLKNLQVEIKILNARISALESKSGDFSQLTR